MSRADVNSLVLASVMTSMLRGGRRRIAAPRTPEQIAAAERRAERQRWNDEVEARKSNKKSKGSL